MNKTLHIVSFANPLPADYGGAIEVYYKLKALNELGIKIIFHVFLYGKQKKDHRLNQYCYQVYYYKITFRSAPIGKYKVSLCITNI